MKRRIHNLSIVTAHFAEFGWTRLLIDRIKRFTADSVVREIIIINQDRSLASREKLLELHPKVRVVEYPRSEEHFRDMGHDHAAVLNRVMSEVKGEFICLMDSDAHPVSSLWLEKCNGVLEDFDAIVADDPDRLGYSHPCFMLFPAKFIKLPLVFDDGLFTDGTDTGRLIGRQLRQSGASVYHAAGTRCFGGAWGYMFLNCIYHHAHGSFSGGDYRLKTQLDWQHAFFTKIVQRHRRYALTFKELLQFKVFSKWHVRAGRP